MNLYTVKLNAWTSPVWVQARNGKIASAMALQKFPTCDCCGAQTTVESVKKMQGSAPHYTSVLMQIVK